jgi:hypothetical protein
MVTIMLCTHGAASRDEDGGGAAVAVAAGQGA